MKTLSPPAAPSRLSKVLSGLQSRNFDFRTSTEYGGPGYSTDKPIIIFGNWNSLTESELAAVESVAEIEWSDEWVQDDGGRAFRSSPDCYFWEPSFFIHHREVVPYDSFPDSGEELAETLKEYGFTCQNGDTIFKCLPSCVSADSLETIAEKMAEGQSGFFPGMDDTPQKFFREVKDYAHYVFRKSEQSQFYSSFEFWRLND